MARKRISGAEGASMDSLMDTLTNVVGILIVILILAQLSAARQVKQILSDLAPVSAEELERTRAETADARARLEAVAAEIAALELRRREDTRAQAALQSEILRIETELKKAAAPAADLAALLASLRLQEKKLEATRAELAALMEEREKLEALLASTPEPRAPAPKVVRIPASKPLPENARIERFFVTGKRVHHLENVNAIAAIEREIVQSRRELEKDVIREKGKSPRVIYDQQKIVDRFTTRAPKPRDVEVTVPPNRPWTRLAIHFRPRADGGEPGDKALLAGSRFQNLLRGYGGSTIVYFHVTPDSFDTYLGLRELVDRRNLPAGWEIVGRAEFRHTMQDIEVNRLEDPPQPPPGAPAPATPAIPAPRKTLD